MSTITIPAQVAEMLRTAVAATRLVDEEGHVLGSFSPEQCPDGLTAEEWAEIKRRRNSKGPWLSTAEVLTRLAAREKSA
jgi:hypothetical protein